MNIRCMNYKSASVSVCSYTCSYSEKDFQRSKNFRGVEHSMKVVRAPYRKLLKNIFSDVYVNRG